MITFEEFPKIARLSRDMIITEKLDGTNAQVIVTENGEVAAGSRSRLITPADDNYGFAAWVRDHADELRELGPGRHFGEWWGQGIQRKYSIGEKRFSLFNVGRWADAESRPACCHVVPVLYEGPFDTGVVSSVMNALAIDGSIASPGFMRPEGVVVFHSASGALFKKTFEKDDAGKWATHG